MGRRGLSTKVRIDGGPVAGGSGTELRLYNDEALTTLSTIYQRSSGVGTQPNPLTPNAGMQTQLSADRVAGDAFVDVVDVTGFQVGDLIPIYDGTNSVDRVITAINPATKRISLDQALGFAFTAAATLVGNEDMTGHIWGYLDDAGDKWIRPKDVASGRLLPAMQIPVRVPNSALIFQKNDVLVASEGTLDVRQLFDLVDDPGNTRIRFEFQDYVSDTDGATVTMDFSTGSKHKVTLGGNRTLAFTNGKAVGVYTVRITQDATGGRTVTWPAAVRWAGGVAPTLTTTPGKTDYFQFLFDGTNYDAVGINQNF